MIGPQDFVEGFLNPQVDLNDIQLILTILDLQRIIVMHARLVLEKIQ